MNFFLKNPLGGLLEAPWLVGLEANLAAHYLITYIDSLIKFGMP